MTINEYQELAQRTSRNISAAEHLVNGALGLSGEAGEVADLVKKHMFQGHEIDFERIAKELGDVCWYIAETASAIGYDLETIMSMNIEKLKKRYPDGFEPGRSIKRESGDV